MVVSVYVVAVIGVVMSGTGAAPSTPRNTRYPARSGAVTAFQTSCTWVAVGNDESPVGAGGGNLSVAVAHTGGVAGLSVLAAPRTRTARTTKHFSTPNST